MQETKAHIDQVEEEARKLSWEHSYWSSATKKGYSGVATFTNIEPKQVQFNFMEILDYESEGRIVMSDHGAFDLYNIYFPNGGSGLDRHNFKQKFFEGSESSPQRKS